ncbi:MAG: flavodoxin family protein [Promethearchaeia archaeon]
MKKITLIVGSPRKNRSCNFLIENAIEGVKSTSEDFDINKIYITDFDLSPCTGCDQCLREPFECPLAENDDTHDLEKHLLDADAILIASPTYFGSVSAQIKTLIDRSRPWKMNGYQLANTIFAPLVAQGLRNGGGGGVITDLVNFALIQGMICVGCLGNPVIEENIPVTSLQKYKRTDFLKKEETDDLGAKIAQNLGKRVAELLQRF